MILDKITANISFSFITKIDSFDNGDLAERILKNDEQ